MATNTGLFSTPEQVIAAQQQAQAAQDPNTALRAALMGAGRAAGGAFGRGLGAAPPPESEAVRLARTRSEAMKGVDFTNRESLIKGVQSLSSAGDYAGAQQLATQIPDAPEVEWETKEFKTGTKDNPLFENWAMLNGQQHHLISTGDRSKAGGTTVNLGDKAGVRFAYEQFTEAASDSKIAQNTISNLNYIDTALAGIETGSLTDMKVSLSRLGKSFNLPIPDDVANLESGQAAMGDLVMGILGKFKGAISDGERKFAASIVPKLTQTSEGRKQISEMMRTMSQRAIKRREMMGTYMRGTPSMFPEKGSDFFSEWDAFTDNNPLFKGQDTLEQTPTGLKDMSDEDLMKSLNLGG